jgi:hypothetical protein
MSPRFVRPVFLSASATDSRNVPGTVRSVSPRDRSGGIDAVLTVREHGSVSPCLSLHAIGSQNAHFVSVRVTCDRPGIVTFPDGRTVTLPTGSVLGFETFQDTPPPIDTLPVRPSAPIRVRIVRTGKGA